MVYLTRSNFESGETDYLGPFEWLQITYNTVRVQDNLPNMEYLENSADTIARYSDYIWKFADGTEWTDLIITDVLETR